MVATDAYCTQLLAAVDDTFNPISIVPTLSHAETLGLGTANLDDVEIIELDV